MNTEAQEVLTPENQTHVNQSARDASGRFTKGNKPVAGFNVNPQNIGNGRWRKEDSISYQYNMLIRLSADKFSSWKSDHSVNARTIAQEIAFEAVEKAREDLGYLKEITDRIEGKAISRTELSGVEGKAIEVKTDLSPEQKEAVNQGIKDIFLKVYGDTDKKS